MLSRARSLVRASASFILFSLRLLRSHWAWFRRLTASRVYPLSIWSLIVSNVATHLAVYSNVTKCQFSTVHVGHLPDNKIKHFYTQWFRNLCVK